MKALLLLLVFVPPVFAQSDIDLGHRTATFTNLQGRVYQDVQLDRATLDGLIYSKPTDSTIGMVKYSDLNTNFLTSLKIPADRIQIAARRQAALAAETKQYDAASHRLALQQQQAELANATAVSQAQAAAASGATSTTETNSAAQSRHHKKKK
mgnify:CR=1 FL=1